jgi:TPP-dependent pyruvate/acetoin dehydrogenase alpha subunit
MREREIDRAVAPDAAQRLWMYERMLLSRRIEDGIGALYLEGKTPVFNMAAGPLPGEMHLSKGQEPCAVGVCVHLDAGDFVTAGHRPHHVAIAKGVDPKTMVAEILGRATGLSRGKGGHMHLFAPEVGFSCSGIVGQGIGIAVGHALAARLQGSRAVAVAFTGEGAANQGIFHEAMNLAALWKLPFVCVIEDNRWGVSVPKSKSTAVARNSDRAVAYGCAGAYVEGNDPDAIFAAARGAVERARAGEGPTILEIETTRLAGHFLPDPETYVPKDELRARRDPIDVLRASLLDRRQATVAELESLERRVAAEAADALGHAKASPFPEPAEALEHVYA